MTSNSENPFESHNEPLPPAVTIVGRWSHGTTYTGGTTRRDRKDSNMHNSRMISYNDLILSLAIA